MYVYIHLYLYLYLYLYLSTHAYFLFISLSLSLIVLHPTVPGGLPLSPISEVMFSNETAPQNNHLSHLLPFASVKNINKKKTMDILQDCFGKEKTIKQKQSDFQNRGWYMARQLLVDAKKMAKVFSSLEGLHTGNLCLAMGGYCACCNSHSVCYKGYCKCHYNCKLGGGKQELPEEIKKKVAFDERGSLIKCNCRCTKKVCYKNEKSKCICRKHGVKCNSECGWVRKRKHPGVEFTDIRKTCGPPCHHDVFKKSNLKILRNANIEVDHERLKNVNVFSAADDDDEIHLIDVIITLRRRLRMVGKKLRDWNGDIEKLEAGESESDNEVEEISSVASDEEDANQVEKENESDNEVEEISSVASDEEDADQAENEIHVMSDDEDSEENATDNDDASSISSFDCATTIDELIRLEQDSTEEFLMQLCTPKKRKLQESPKPKSKRIYVQ